LAGRILFSQHDPTKNSHEVLMIPASGGAPTLVLDQASQPAVSPDGLSIAFHSWQSDRLGILVAPLAGGAREVPMRMTYVEDVRPSWAPDSKRLVFGSNRHGDRKWRVYVTWIEGRDEAQDIVYGESPDWSPVADRIVYRGCGPQCQVWGLYLTDSQGSWEELLLADPSATAPAWSPDGQSIAFMSSRDGNWELYLVASNGLGLRRLIANPGQDGAPVWSPDSKWIAFLSHRGGTWGIYVIPAQSGQEPRLIHQVRTEYPDWMIERLAWIP
jgi:TolB protein